MWCLVPSTETTLPNNRRLVKCDKLGIDTPLAVGDDKGCSMRSIVFCERCIVVVCVWNNCDGWTVALMRLDWTGRVSIRAEPPWLNTVSVSTTSARYHLALRDHRYTTLEYSRGVLVNLHLPAFACVLPLSMFSIKTLKEITSIEQLLSVFVTRMRDVYVVGCLGNASLQADCFNPCY